MGAAIADRRVPAVRQRLRAERRHAGQRATEGLMPEALLRPCPGGGGTCPELTTGGPCHAHAREREQRRGKTAARGLDTAHWRAFRARFTRMLLAAGIAPVCGAALPEGPTVMTTCRVAGVLTANQLELHHAPPLTPAERKDWRAVCDKRRVAWVCHDCHSAITAGAAGR
jgi:hypothetical protein